MSFIPESETWTARPNKGPKENKYLHASIQHFPPQNK